MRKSTFLNDFNKLRNFILTILLFPIIFMVRKFQGNQNVWMACAFFTSVWKATPFGRQELVCHFSLSKLLELCQVSVLDFFDKLNKWADMIVASHRLLDHIHRVQSNLAVSVVVFKKFLLIFQQLFINNIQQPAMEQTDSKPRTRQQSRSPQKPQNKQQQNQTPSLTTASLFEFSWLAFIALKSTSFL